MTQNQWGNLNKDFIKAVRGGGVTVLWKYFIKFWYFLNDGFPKDNNNIPPGGQGEPVVIGDGALLSESSLHYPSKTVSCHSTHLQIFTLSFHYPSTILPLSFHYPCIILALSFLYLSNILALSIHYPSKTADHHPAICNPLQVKVKVSLWVDKIW